jgi:hypothetical protein
MQFNPLVKASIGGGKYRSKEKKHCIVISVNIQHDERHEILNQWTCCLTNIHQCSTQPTYALAKEIVIFAQRTVDFAERTMLDT